MIIIQKNQDPYLPKHQFIMNKHENIKKVYEDIDEYLVECLVELIVSEELKN